MKDVILTILLASLLLPAASADDVYDQAEEAYRDARDDAVRHAAWAAGLASPATGPAEENATADAERADGAGRAIAGDCFDFTGTDRHAGRARENATGANATLEGEMRHAGNTSRDPDNLTLGREALRVKARADNATTESLLAAGALSTLSRGALCRLGAPAEETAHGAVHNDTAEALDAADDVVAQATGHQPGLEPWYAHVVATAEEPLLDRGIDPYHPFPPPDLVAILWNEACPFVPGCSD